MTRISRHSNDKINININIKNKIMDKEHGRQELTRCLNLKLRLVGWWMWEIRNTDYQ